MPKKPKAEKIPVTVMLDPDLFSMMDELLKSRPGRTIGDSLEELLVDPIIRSHYLEKTAPQRGYDVPVPVADEEAAAVNRAVAPMIKELLADHRKEAVAFGLLAAGFALCHRIVTDGGFVYPAQIAGQLADEILGHLKDKAAVAEYRRLNRRARRS